MTVLEDYRERREKFLAGRQVAHWFVNARGERLGYDAVLKTFHRLIKRIGLHGQNGGRRPRLHDFRHSFAMATLVQWYRDGKDVERRLPVLSAYLGHVEIRDTYWYLSAWPELLAAAKERLEQRWEKTS